jgi:hypothetical protein
MFPIIQVPEHVERREFEPLGTKRKFWFERDDGTHWLFKYARPTTGEHWAERLAAAIASALGIPHSDVELAQHQGEWGTISRDFTDRGRRALVHGNELLYERFATYPSTVTYRAKDYTLDAVHEILAQSFIGPSEEISPRLPEPKAFSQMAGYLLLDAVIGNTDRHHENWGVLLDSSSPRHAVVAPSYDHASSLGRELTDDARLQRLASRDERRGLPAYASRTRSALHREAGDARPMTPIDAFGECARHAPEAVDWWLDQLAIAQFHLLDGIDAMPEEAISPPARMFAAALVERNVETLIGSNP